MSAEQVAEKTDGCVFGAAVVVVVRAVAAVDVDDDDDDDVSVVAVVVVAVVVVAVDDDDKHIGSVESRQYHCYPESRPVENNKLK